MLRNTKVSNGPPSNPLYAVMIVLMIISALFGSFWALYFAFVPEREFKEFRERVIHELDRLERHAPL